LLFLFLDISLPFVVGLRDYFFPHLLTPSFQSEYSTTESSDGVEKQELDYSSDEEPCFFDTKEGFPESPFMSPTPMMDTEQTTAVCRSENPSCDPDNMHSETGYTERMLPHVERRKKLPQPIEKEKGVSLWSIIKDNVGNDLTRVCLPVYFNEPLSSLQKCFEDLEYSYLLDQAYEYGKMVRIIPEIDVPRIFLSEP